MSAVELVTVIVDGREAQVPKGTGLVETAATAGVEIPVFCYEPRLGPPVGACRMCLVEVEGMPKLQAGCTLTAQAGMVVLTAATSAKAAEGQNATLEFILVNHPLDCPVCDKGGECPLQDLTFRYGPGNTRMTFPKRTFEKPIPISPTIALDRERCILCYRCTRFSENVSEDGELVAVNRGAQSMIATFDGDPYRSAFSGNVVELCPVGALTSTQYRFEARPWEIQNVPTVCGLCPVGCNITATTREGKVKRILSRNHPELDEGWLCDKGRFGFSHLGAADRVREPLQRAQGRRLQAASWSDALDRFEQLLRDAGDHVVTAFSGSESIEMAYGLARVLRAGAGAHSGVLLEDVADALDAYRLPLAEIGSAQLVVVIGDEPIVERAPVVDLWVKAARRNGADVVTVGVAGDVKAPLGGAAEVCAGLADSELGARIRGTERAVVIWSGPGAGGGTHLAAAAEKLGLGTKPGSGALYLPATPNARAISDAWSAASDAEPADPHPIKLLVVSGDDAAADASVRAMAEHAENVVAIALFAEPLRGWVDLVLPATSYLERDGTTMNLEGRLQRQRRAVVAPFPDELEWLSQLAERFGVELSPYAPLVWNEVAGTCYGGITYAEVGERAPLPSRGEAQHVEAPAPEPRGTVGGGPLLVQRYRPLFSGPVVERVEELQFQRPAAEIELSADDAKTRGIAAGDEVVVQQNGTSVTLRARLNRALVTGVVRIAEEHAPELHRGGVEVSKA
jgi:NADH-quinone oxidoreductase subunit G